MNNIMTRVKKADFRSTNTFDLKKIEFLEKLGEGKSLSQLSSHIGAFGKVRLVRKLKDYDSSSTDEESSAEEMKGPRALSLFEKDAKKNLVAVKILSKY